MNVMAKRDAPVRPDLNNPELNNLAMSKEAQPLFDAVMKHIEENVAPISEKFFKLGEGRKDNWSWAPGQLELLDGAKAKAKSQRPVELLPARRRDRRGPLQPRLRLHRRRARQEPARVGVPQLLGARHRQHGGARAGRHARAEGAVAEAAAQRRDPLGLRHDRAGRRLVGRQEHRHARRARRRRVGDQRREVLHLRRRRSALQDHDLHGADQPGRARRTSSSRRSSCRSTRPASRSSGRCTCSATTTRRTATCTSASTTSACRRRTSCSARAAASRSPRSASDRAASTTACARSARPRRRSS